MRLKFETENVIRADRRNKLIEVCVSKVISALV